MSSIDAQLHADIIIDVNTLHFRSVQRLRRVRHSLRGKTFAYSGLQCVRLGVDRSHHLSPSTVNNKICYTFADSGVFKFP